MVISEYFTMRWQIKGLIIQEKQSTTKKFEFDPQDSKESVKSAQLF